MEPDDTPEPLPRDSLGAPPSADPPLQSVAEPVAAAGTGTAPEFAQTFPGSGLMPGTYIGSREGQEQVRRFRALRQARPSLARRESAVPVPLATAPPAPEGGDGTSDPLESEPLQKLLQILKERLGAQCGVRQVTELLYRDELVLRQVVSEVFFQRRGDKEGVESEGRATRMVLSRRYGCTVPVDATEDEVTAALASSEQLQIFTKDCLKLKRVTSSDSDTLSDKALSAFIISYNL
eukprot:Hpha_TRINITY_DN651_c0_g1::TRINITY_DN651_c0_g1_i1::g.21218::m.21218